LTVFGLIAAGALVGALWVERRTAIMLPAPTGSFAVGRATNVWTDDQHVDMLAPVPGTKRELLVWMWYPAAARQSRAADDYVPAHIRAAIGPPANPLQFLTRDLSKVQGHSMRDADWSPQPRSYPVVIMRAGASAGVVGYSALAEDLASHGYVVVGFDAPYRTSIVALPDGRVLRRTPENNPEHCAELQGAEQERCIGRVITAWTADMSFVLDRLERLNTDASGTLTGRLDLTRVGVFGHSLGGATAAQFCHDDPRCKAGIDIDGAPHGSVIQAGLAQPFMFLLGHHGDSSDPETRRIVANIQSIYDRLPADRRLRIAIRGANHFLFSDDGALLKSHIVLGALRMFRVVGIDGRRQLAVTTHCVHSFFDAYLKGTGGSPLDVSSTRYPEIEVLE
jgi:pimeloyl-ACP methyl ester carboxylesterase